MEDLYYKIERLDSMLERGCTKMIKSCIVYDHCTSKKSMTNEW